MLTLLVADADHKLCREIETCCCMSEDIRLIRCVHNGTDVLRCMEQEQIDILLMDIVMPELDGLGVLLHMQTTTFSHKPAVFINTAFVDNRVMQELQAMGVVYCFVKPMHASYILQRMTMLTRSSSAPAPLLSDTTTAAPPHKEELGGRITAQIRAVGVPAHLRGYHYLRTAIQYFATAEDPSCIAVTKDVYPAIAQQYNTRPALVERAIRNAIDVAWTRGNTAVLRQYFGYTMEDCKGKPTNAEFIAMIADHVRLRV
ncbi:sporulation transcription factor Spo0A [Christensenellaceae bacterium OttesenSCG-928-L17]|nr:sporulation transcription factor Spo0A [Christensenellaceae bacterium OttesenSCG-928-L17]